MKKVVIMLVIVCMAVMAQAQRQRPTVELLDSYTLDGDTSLVYSCGDDYRGLIQVECTGLDALDATIGIKQKLAGFTKYVYLTNDTTTYGDGCSKFLIDNANYSAGYQYDNTPGDTLKIELLNNSVTSGTIKVSIRRYYND